MYPLFFAQILSANNTQSAFVETEKPERTEISFLRELIVNLSKIIFGFGILVQVFFPGSSNFLYVTKLIIKYLIFFSVSLSTQK